MDHTVDRLGWPLNIRTAVKRLDDSTHDPDRWLGARAFVVVAPIGLVHNVKLGAATFRRTDQIWRTIHEQQSDDPTE